VNLLPAATIGGGAICMPDVDDPALERQVRELRATGEVVINCLSGAPDPRCDRQLIEQDEQWRVQPLNTNDRV
jgi:ATP phosphoribosyltransferase regulatory subunit